jgi:peptidyl-prolyl cis-trans isomerase B (cyclophilin B)
VATNQMRREAAKRKLARQQERRVAQAKRRRQWTVIGSVVAVVVVVAAVVLVTTLNSAPSAAPAAAPASSAPAAGACSYPAGEASAKQVNPPAGDPTVKGGSPKVALTTSAGPIGLTLEPAKATCTVNSFLSLVSQKYFDSTPCHRLTTGEGLKVLQCGDPTGAGNGGPGYTIPDENPTDLKAAPSGQGSIYPRGTVAMANTGQPNSGGSQFFLVYADSTLPPNYAVFGTVDAAGLATLDKIAAAGTKDGGGDGAPKTAVTITTAAAA